MFHSQVRNLLEKCRAAKRSGISMKEILATVVPEAGRELLASPNEFLDWIQTAPELSYFYYDALAQGICAKPKEVVATILEAIVSDELEENSL